MEEQNDTTSSTKKTQLLDLLPETITNDILPLVNHNDLLRLRRVCKKLKDFADDYISLKAPPIYSQIELVDKKDSTFSSDSNHHQFELSEIIELNPCPSSAFFFYNIRDFEHAALQKFLDLFAHQITHLKVQSITLPHLENEMKFYKSLPNLSHLRIEEINLNRRTQSHLPGETLEGSDFPNLTDLTVANDNSKSLATTKFFWNLVKTCPKLETFRIPEYPNLDKPEYDALTIVNGIALRSLKERHENSKMSRIKKIDLKNYRSMFTFPDLCREFTDPFKVKLENLNPTLINSIFGLMMAEAGSIISSFRGYFNSANFSLDLPHLEKVKLGYGDIFFVDQFRQMKGPTPEMGKWDNLKNIDVLVNNTLEPYESLDWEELFHFLFKMGGPNSRENVTDLTLTYKYKLESGSEQEDLPLPIPRTKYIASSCPNITNLTLVEWPGKNRALLQLWEGLPLLESVTLENIPQLGNVAFVGEDVTDPVFLRLKELKCLRLRKLEEMPKVTDTVFKLVFCHLPLSELELQASKPLPMVTVDGVRALLKGKFAETIQKFSFQNWTLKDISKEEFQTLAMEFRSSHML